ARLDACHHGAITQRHRHMALAYARGPEQHDVPAALDEAERGEFLDLLPRCAGGEAEVVALDRLHRGQCGKLQQCLPDALGLGGQHALEQRSEEVRKAGLSVGGTLSQSRPFSAHHRQLQLFAQRGDALLLEAHAASSSSAWYTDSGCCSDSRGMTLPREIAGALWLARIGSAVSCAWSSASRTHG